MRSFIGILTYRRLAALQAMMAGIEEHCPQYQCAIAEDCGQRDNTSDFLKTGRSPLTVRRPDLMATQYVDTGDPTVTYLNAQVFLGDRNLGVAGNSNRLIKLFMESDCDHLCLCNDDLLVKGDFVHAYAQAHEDLGVGLFCFCDFDKASPAISGKPESYKWVTYPWRGYKVKMLPRMTGIMMSMTRAVIEKIGYFDTEFGKFGEEHCDFNIRARLAGFIQMEKQDMNCLDIEHGLLQHQDVPTSFYGAPRQQADQLAAQVMSRATREYGYRHYYRPFRLVYPPWSGGYLNSGISTRQLEQVGYHIVSDLV
jgi:GT2 family glycosyltransferase